MMFAAQASACLWDSDTLKNEAQKFPGLLEVATGWFERNPPLYYQMRLDRVTKLLHERPENLNAYDDAGVASDRLGNDDQAIHWMQLKAKKLESLGPRGTTNREGWYRYYANEGTFYAHQWIRGGKRPEKIVLLKKAISDIEQALAINPDAHFGREAVQLSILRWMLAKTGKNGSDELLGWYLRDLKRDKVIKGLSGLVVLGNAWESAEVFEELSHRIFRERRVSEFLALRAQELRKQQGGATANSQERPDTTAFEVPATYALFRKAAEDERARRDTFMIAKMKQGKHPDTDPTFWSGYKPLTKPEIVDLNAGQKLYRWWWTGGNGPLVTIMAVLAIAFLVICGLLVRNRIRRIRSARQ